MTSELRSPDPTSTTWTTSSSADANLERVTATVRTLSIAFGGVAVAWSGAASVSLPDGEVVFPLTLAMIALFATTYALATRGRTRIAAWMFTVGLWVSTTWSVVISGGVDAAGTSVFVVVIMAAGLLTGAASAVGMALVSSLTTLGIAWLDSQGLLPRSIEQSASAPIGVAITIFVATAALLWDALRRLDDALAKAELSEARTRSQFNQAADGIVILDRDGRIIDANDRTVEVSGYSREQIARLHMSDFLEGGELEDATEIFSVMTPGVTYQRERVLRMADGRGVPVENSAVLLDDGRVQVFVRDISDRRRAEETNVRLRLALDAAEEGIVFFDLSPGLVYANASFARLSGESVALRKGLSPMSDTFSPETRAYIRAAQPDLRAHGKHAGRFTQIGEDGARSVRYATITEVRDGEGERLGWVGILSDITREVELEESLQLTRKLESVGKLAGGLAHDFNNLLTVILGRAEALRSETPSEDLDEILEAGQRAAAITTKLLAFSRDQVVHTRRIDVSTIVRDASGMLRRLVRESVQIDLDLEPTPLWIDADPSQLQQVLVNLVANSRDAMPGGGRLAISTLALDASSKEQPDDPDLAQGPVAVLRVGDDGQGMEPAVLERLFEPFFTTKNPGQGTGLGLASVREIVRHAGGAIRVKSRPGDGTRVEVFWPLTDASEIESEGAPQPEPPRRSRAARILIVEDEAPLRRLVHRALESRGHLLLAAHDGPEALRLGLADPPDLLVTDVILPGLDGGHLTAQLRDVHPDLPVLMTSGYAPEDMAGTIVEDERTIFLPKPFTLDQLVESVDRLLEQRARQLM